MSSQPNVFVKEGDYWTIRFGTESFRLRDSRGLGYIAALLRQPGREIHALDLAMPAAAAGGADRRGAARDDGLHAGRLGDAGPLLDERAKAAYRKRISELVTDIAEAEDFNDVERAGRARLEMEAIEDQLTAAFGLGGRPRKAGSPAERARVNVRNSITTALRAMAPHGPELTAHLRIAIRTGTFCWYAAEGQTWATEADPTTTSAPVTSPRRAEAETPVEGVLATVVAVELVPSTSGAAPLGDRARRKRLEQQHAAAHDELTAHGGTAVTTAGDTVVAVFEEPGDAIAWSLAFGARIEALGGTVRGGVHTGECVRRGDQLEGSTLDVASLIKDEAGAGEILVSSTVRDIAAGSGAAFGDRGFHDLRGVPGTWRLFEVSSAPEGTRSRAGRKNATSSVSLMIVDDHPMWRQTLRTVLEGSGVAVVVAEAADGEEAVQLARAARPEVVIMDMNLLEMHGVEATRRVLRDAPETKVLVLSSSDERDDVVAAVTAGASGYLLKTAEPHEVSDAVRRISKGELVFPPALAKVVLDELRAASTRDSQTTRASEVSPHNVR